MTTIIGLTGSIGSGCTEIAKIIEKRGYRYLSLSDILKSLYSEECNKLSSRAELQNFGNRLRKEMGEDYLARRAAQMIDREKECDKWVVDSLRNPAEIYYLKGKYRCCFTIGVYASYDVRRVRKKAEYEENPALFKEDDQRDINENIKHGQRVGDCFIMADVIVPNNEEFSPGDSTYLILEEKIDDYLRLIKKKVPLHFC